MSSLKFPDLSIWKYRDKNALKEFPVLKEFLVLFQNVLFV